MNTCSRVETTGKPGHIHISQQTADLLKSAGKEGWCIPRKDKVMVSLERKGLWVYHVN